MTATLERTREQAEDAQRDATINLALGNYGPTDTFPIPPVEAFEIPDPNRGEDDEPRYHDYIAAPAVERIAAMLIARHGHFGHLREADITYRWKREGGKEAGKLKLGQVRRLDALMRHFADADLLIWVAADNCAANRLTVRQMEACVFHQLCHVAPAGTEEEPKLAMAPHDWEGFTAEWHEYGPWRAELKLLAKVIQPMLPGIGA